MNSELCPQCWDMAGLDNSVNDNGGDPEVCGDWRAEADALLAVIVKRGGDADRVKRANTYLFPEK